MDFHVLQGSELGSGMILHGLFSKTPEVSKALAG